MTGPAVEENSTPNLTNPPNREKHEVRVNLNFDRTTKVYQISDNEYALILKNENIYDIAYKVKMGAEVLIEGVVPEQKEITHTIKFIPSIKQRQILLVNYNDVSRCTSSPTIMIIVDQISQ